MPFIIILNVVGIILGTLLGCILKKHISKELNNSMILGLAVISAAIGVILIQKAVNMSAAVIAFLLGGTIGHLLGIDKKLSNITKYLPESGGKETAETLLIAFTLYCISTTGIIGALLLGFEGDTTVLTTKAIMDFTASIFFAMNSGWILSLISIPLLMILFLFYNISGYIMPYLTPEMIGDFSACGGLIQLLNGIRIAKLKNPPVADFMPALMLVFFTSWFWTNFM